MARTSQRSNTERFKYGICLNDECAKCKGKEVQQIPMRKEFVCEECGSELRECPPPKKRNNKQIIVIIVVAIAVIGGGVGVALGISSSNEKKAAARLEDLRIEDSIRQVREAEEQNKVDSLAQIAAEADANRQQQIADSIEQTRIADSIANAETAAAAKAAKKVAGATSSGSNLGWGSYSGPMQGGKPHGVGGTIKVKQSRSIDLKDGRGSKLQVNPGETIENTKFENGRLRAGELHRNDGFRKWFNC